MTLRQQQSLFAKLLPRLLDKAYELGYEITLGEAWRPEATANIYADLGIGSKNSLHRDRLAIDLNLFKNGRYLRSTESHKPLGEYWEGLHPLCRWGGRFTKPDGNHYSLARGKRA
jgi:hypothetical protein